MGKDLEGNGSDVIEVISGYIPGGAGENNEKFHSG
jgi:hypothetical protein